MKKVIFLCLACIVLCSFASAQKADTTKVSVPVGEPVILRGDTLFSIYSRLGPFNPTERATTVNTRLNQLLENKVFSPDSLYLIDEGGATHIMWRDNIIVSITDEDAKTLSTKRKELGSRYLTILKDHLSLDLSSKGIQRILLQVGLTLLELFIIFLIIRYTNKLFVFTKRKIVSARGKILKGIRFKGYEFLDTDRELKVALFLNMIVKWVVIVLVLYLALPILFSIFPWTRGWADTLFGYVLNPVRRIAGSIINYIPNLFTIIVIYMVTRYAIRFLEFLTNEIHNGALVIDGFYPDWAKPTFNIVKVLMYAFMFIVIFPYLPGSDSPVFQGVSVFLGILFSLGSSSAISNMVAGFVITYMRPFKVGDRIKIGELTGIVIEKSTLVTRIRTTKNEEITIPNASVLSGHTINYTTSARDLGLILHTSVTIGYDVPWKQVHELLIQAALEAEGIIQLEEKRPFVLQTSLDDFYVSYQLNAYTDQPERMPRIYSSLHQNIQDKFNEAGLEIMSPHYSALRDGNTTAVPSSYLPPNYKAPSFKITGDNKDNA